MKQHSPEYKKFPTAHQTSINFVMGPDTYRESNERTPLLQSSRQSQLPNTPVSGQVRKMGFLGQVGLLLWKGILQQRRSVKVTLAEIFIPLLGAVIMLVIRQVVVVNDVLKPTTYSPKDLGTTAAGNLTRDGTLMLYAPNNNLVNGLMEKINLTLNTDGLKAHVMGFSSEQDLETFYSNSTHSSKCPISVVFNDVDQAANWPKDLTYKIRPRTEDKDNWQTRKVFSFYQVLSPRTEDDLYYTHGFLYTQRIIAEALIKQWNPDANLTSYTFETNRIPFPPYIDDVMVQVLQQNFPVVLMLSFILSVIIMSKNIVYEKERQLKESMKLMGLSASAHWTAWFVQYFIYLVVACAIYTLFMSVGIGGKKAVLVYSDPSLIFVFLLIYSVSIITYCFFISTLVNKANVAAALSGILFFAIFFPYYFLEQRYADLSLNVKLGVCFLFNMAMSYGMKTVGLYEGSGNGAQWNSFTKPASIDDNFSLLHSMVMLVLDSAIFLILTWYIDNIHPGTYGVPRPWYFPFQVSYWCGGKKHKDLSADHSGYNIDDSHFERDPIGLPVGIKMVHLRKVFEKSKIAVEDSTLTMYEGQISVLLGHNGAGKTTTMSMLTGFIPPTSGTAYVNGFDIRTDISNVRNNLGLCPQHNVLFDNLTVDEHLTFFAKLKGCQKNEIPSMVADMAKEVGLELKRKEFSKTLSGGQKRKLSVGIALIGGSKIVILDEPTSGMDPAARRQTWDVLQRHRAGRTMLLSTHFMDEADLLGDRIAIMAEGVVKCCGTSMFLKKLYGAGYHLVMVKAPGCNVDAITKTVNRVVDSAYLEGEVGAELSFLLPQDQAPKFSELFSMIEKNCSELGITSFGVTATTMEEVFLKVGASGSSDELFDKPASAQLRDEMPENCVYTPIPVSDGFTNCNYTSSSESLMETSQSDENSALINGSVGKASSISVNMQGLDVLGFNKDFERLFSFDLDVSRFYGMFVKKAIHTFRNRVISTVQLALPVIFTIAALTVDKVQPKDSNAQPLTLDLSMFDGSISAYSSGLNPNFISQSLGSNYSALFHGDNTIQQINRSQYKDINQFYLTQAHEIGLYTYNKKVVIGANFEPNSGDKGLVATSWYSGQPYHAMPTALAYLMNAVARQVAGNQITITTINHPMPKDDLAAAQDDMLTTLMLGFSIGFSMLFGMAFLTSSFSYFLIKERQSGAKHLQVVSGVGPFAFWLASFAWDMINYIIPCLVLLIVFAAFQVEAYTDGSNLGLVLWVLLTFGFAVLPFMYILQFHFNTPATGFVVLIILAIISGLFTMLTVFIMRIPTLDVVDVADILDWLFMAIFPHYALGMGFSNFYINKLDKDFCDKSFATVNITPGVLCPILKDANLIHPCCPDDCGNVCMPYNSNYLAWNYPGIGRNLLFMYIQGFFYFALTLMIEYQVPQKLSYFIKGKNKSDFAPLPVLNATNYNFEDSAAPRYEELASEDNDVAEERHRVMANKASKDVLVLKNLFRQYGTHVAVDHTCVGVPEQECFGLLGQNGAGKTTTFKMLTGDVMASSGDAIVRGYSIKTDIKRVQANLGYCPQFDALIDQMTGRETLTMYARLRGVPPYHIPRVVSNLLSILLLDKHADKLTSYYSGGNKRKLSTAIALVGNPAVVLLDEPSSGMDPAARRQLWNVLSQVRASGKTLVLTSHSMEECDALCTRIAIMVNGEFKCLGSPQHLKSKFGHGYTLVAKLATLDSDLIAPSQPLIDFIFTTFPGSQKFDDHQGYIHFQVPDAGIPLSQLFSAMEQAKSRLKVEDYTVHQTTLEQIFLTFTRAQFPPREIKDRSILHTVCPCLT